MAASLLVSGPSLLYINTGAAANWVFLGYGESDLMMDTEFAQEDVNTDLSGPACPEDIQYFNGTAMISTVLTRYDEKVVQLLKAGLDITGTNDNTFGTFAPGSSGTLIQTENRNFGLCVVSVKAALPVYAGAGLAPGYTFPFAVPVGRWTENLGQRVKKVRASFRCIPRLVVTGSGLGGSTLHTPTIPAGLPNP